MSGAIIADTGGLLRALARTPTGAPSWPPFAYIISQASRILVPALVLAEVDYFLRDKRTAMRQLVAEIFDPATTYEFEPALPADIARALQIDAKFKQLRIGLVDGTVAALAERRQVYRVLTTDHRDFVPLRIGPRYERPLTLVP